MGRNIRIMFTLGQTPTWASSAPDVENVYGPGYGSVPRDIEDWKRFVRALLRRYGGWIHSVEVSGAAQVEESQMPCMVLTCIDSCLLAALLAPPWVLSVCMLPSQGLPASS